MSLNDPSKPDLVGLLGKDWLNIGGTSISPGWKILNIQKGEHVDYVADILDLSQFENQSFDVIYTSHTLEHLSYQKDLPAALCELYRILRPDGKLFVSVPDMDCLCRLFVHEQLMLQDRFHIMRMIFGGQVDEHDFHCVGLNMAFLADYLRKAGFSKILRVPEFKVFDDTSSLRFAGVLISLNVIATK